MNKSCRFPKQVVVYCSLILSWFLIFSVVLPGAAKDSSIVLEEYANLPAGSAPGGLVYGPQQALWVTGLGNNSVYQLKPASGGYTDPGKGVIAVLPIALTASDGLPFDVTVGMDKAIWVSDPKLEALYQVVTGNTPPVLPYPLPQEFNLDAAEMVVGRDQAVWFTAYEADQIGRIDQNGVLNQFPLNAGTRPLGISNDADGNIWFTAWGTYQLGKISLDGSITLFELPSKLYRPTEMVRDPGGSLWFIYAAGYQVSRIDPRTGVMEHFPLSTASNAFMDLRIGPDGKVWLLGTNGLGNFEITETGPANYQETLFASPVFEGQGRSQLTSGGDGYLYFTRLDRDAVYRSAAADTALRDLQLTTEHMTDYVLAAGAFYILLDVTNWSQQEAFDLELTVSLDEGIRFDSLSDYDPALCSVTGLEVRCALGNLPAGTSKTLRLNFSSDTALISGGEHHIVAEINLPGGDYYPENNQTEQRFEVLQKFEYFNDFSDRAEEALWSHTDLFQPNPQQSYLGRFSNDNVFVQFEPLPLHDRVRSCFRLYVNGGWDGDQFINPDDPTAVIGPDIWAHYIDENDLVVTTFSNQAQFSQAFPDAYREGKYPAQQGARQVGDFDGDGQANDARYDFCFVQPHTNESLKLTFYGVNLTKESGETWGIDDVSVEIYYHDAYDWLYLPMLTR